MTVARAKAGATPLQLTAIKLMSHHNNHSSSSDKIPNELAKTGKIGKKTWPNNILMYPVEARLRNPALHERVAAAPQAGWDQAQDT